MKKGRRGATVSLPRGVLLAAVLVLTIVSAGADESASENFALRGTSGVAVITNEKGAPTFLLVGSSPCSGGRVYRYTPKSLAHGTVHAFDPKQFGPAETTEPCFLPPAGFCSEAAFAQRAMLRKKAAVARDGVATAQENLAKKLKAVADAQKALQGATKAFESSLDLKTRVARLGGVGGARRNLDLHLKAAQILDLEMQVARKDHESLEADLGGHMDGLAAARAKQNAEPGAKPEGTSKDGKSPRRLASEEVEHWRTLIAKTEERRKHCEAALEALEKRITALLKERIRLEGLLAAAHEAAEAPEKYDVAVAAALEQLADALNEAKKARELVEKKWEPHAEAADALSKMEASLKELSQRTALGLSGVDTLSGGTPLILSGSSAGLFGRGGVISGFSPLFQADFHGRGLTGLAVRSAKEDRPLVAALWEGGYPSRGVELKQRRSKAPAIVLQRLPAELEASLETDPLKWPALAVERTLTLDLGPLHKRLAADEKEPMAQRFRAADVVWYRFPNTGASGFIVLLVSHDAAHGEPEVQLLQRFNVSGRPIGAPVDLTSVGIPNSAMQLDWSGLDWLSPSWLVLVHGSGNGGYATAELPESWRWKAAGN